MKATPMQARIEAIPHRVALSRIKSVGTGWMAREEMNALAGARWSRPPPGQCNHGSPHLCKSLKLKRYLKRPVSDAMIPGW